jgi:hypothetical protein
MSADACLAVNLSRGRNAAHVRGPAQEALEFGTAQRGREAP